MTFKRKASYISKSMYKRRYKKKFKRRGKFTTNPGTYSMRRDNIVTVPGKSLMPRRLKTQIRYTATIQLAGVAGVQMNKSIRGNSIFDPDAGSGTTFFANGLDAIASFYSRYAVLGSKIKVDFINTQTVPIRVALFPYTDVNLTNCTFGTVDVLPGSRTTICGLADGANNIKTLTNYASTTSMLNRDPMTDDTVQAATNANPTQQWYWGIIGRAIDDATTSLVSLEVHITYYVVFFDNLVIPYANP